MKNIVIGMLAHVDAGKTTLSEAMLYTAGAIRRLGRVDKRDTFLDTDSVERERGITVYSKQAIFEYGDSHITLLDTPGHTDFACEMERTLSVLDMAVLIISGLDGVQNHTRTLAKLLDRYNLPAIFFVNKMDYREARKEELFANIKSRLSGKAVDFTDYYIEGRDRFKLYEEIASNDDDAMDEFLETDSLSFDTLVRLIVERKIFPVLYGSAINNEGVRELLKAINDFTQCKEYSKELALKVIKIDTDKDNNRLTFLKILGGSISNRQEIEYISADGELVREKINQIRQYSGEKYSTLNEADSGLVVAVTGLTKTRAGQGIGAANDNEAPSISPVFSYKLNILDGSNINQVMPKLKQLEEKMPELNIEWDEALGEITISVSGPILIEVLTRRLKDEYGLEVSFGEKRIVYRESISGKVEGIGHFEPLRHYAEVHLILEGQESGSGMNYRCDCPVDRLAKNWQRLIYTHLCEKSHKGVLIGAPLTDVTVTVVSGRAHPKHTEGGDFRQATYRAIRQGLMKAESVLLEPYYDFEISVNQTYLGKVMTELSEMGEYAHFKLDNTGDSNENLALISGRAPAILIDRLRENLINQARGQLFIKTAMAGFYECHNSDEVIAKRGYNACADTRNTPDSVFCKNGSGFVVPWNEVEKYMHCESVLEPELRNAYIDDNDKAEIAHKSSKELSRTVSDEIIGTEEIDAILKSTYYSNSSKSAKNNRYSGQNLKRKIEASSNEDADNAGLVKEKGKVLKTYEKADIAKNEYVKSKRYLLVDGYNILHAWKELDELSKVTFDGARDKLLEILCNYQAMTKYELIAVFDAYRVSGHAEEYFDYNNIHVVFTREAETADRYIERFSYENGEKYDVTVASSDGLEQIIIRGNGCRLMSALDLYEDVERINSDLRENYIKGEV